MAGFDQRVPALVDISMVAHPSLTLLVDLSEGAGPVHDTDGGRVHGSVAVGLIPGGLRVSGPTAERCRCLQIRLSPVAAAAVLDASTELVGTVVTLTDVWGRDAARTENRLRAATSWDERFTIAADVLGRRLNARAPLDPEVVAAWGRIQAVCGQLRVDDLASEVGWSRKRLWSRFRSQIGLTPKHAARLVRFDHAAHLLAAGDATARVAAVSGYADQSHLHREIRAFTDATPAALAAAPWLGFDDIAWPASSGPPSSRDSP